MGAKFKSNELLKGSIVLFVLFNLFNVLNFVFQFLMARLLTREDFGIFATLITLIYFIAIPFEGIQTITSKYTSKFKVEGKLGKVKNISKKIFRKGIVFSTLVFVLSIPLMYLFSQFVSIKFDLIFLTCLMIFAIFLIPTTRGVMQGMKQFYAFGINLNIDTLTRIFFATFLIYLGWGVYGAVTGILIGTIFAFVISFIPLKSIFKEKEESSNISLKKILNSSSPILIALVGILVMQSVDIILAKRFFSPEIAGDYAVANLIGKMIFFGTLAISKAMFPLSSEKFESGTKTLALFKKSFGIVLALCAISLIAIGLFPELIISILFGEKYLGVSNIVFFMGIAFSLISFANLIFMYAISTNRRISLLHIAPVLIVQVFLLWYFKENLINYSLGMVISSFMLFIMSILAIAKKR